MPDADHQRERAVVENLQRTVGEFFFQGTIDYCYRHEYLLAGMPHGALRTAYRMNI